MRSRVLYGEHERALGLRTAETPRLRHSSYVAAVTLAMAEQLDTDRHRGAGPA